MWLINSLWLYVSQLCWDVTVQLHKGLLFGDKKQSGELSGEGDVKYENNDKTCFHSEMFVCDWMFCLFVYVDFKLAFFICLLRFTYPNYKGNSACKQQSEGFCLITTFSSERRENICKSVPMIIYCFMTQARLTFP